MLLELATTPKGGAIDVTKSYQLVTYYSVTQRESSKLPIAKLYRVTYNSVISARIQ